MYRSLSRPVAAYLRTQGAGDVDDLANDVFLRVFANLDRFSGDEAGFRSWVLTIAHHRLVDERRRRARRPPPGPLPDGADSEAAVDGADDAALARVGTERVRQLLATLSKDQRDVLLLRVVADLTVEQVARVLGKSPGAVKQLQRRGLAALHRRISLSEGRTPP